MDILSRPDRLATSSVGCGDLWQGYISAPELKHRDWVEYQVSRPEYTFPRPLMETHQEPGCGLSH